MFQLNGGHSQFELIMGAGKAGEVGVGLIEVVAIIKVCRSGDGQGWGRSGRRGFGGGICLGPAGKGEGARNKGKGNVS